MSGREHKIIFYTTRRDESPVQEFIDGLDIKAQAKVYALIDRLEQEGHKLRRPQADVIRGNIRELRIVHSSNQYRVLYFFFHGNYIILLHGFTKKTQKIPLAEINRAANRMQDFIERCKSGELIL